MLKSDAIKLLLDKPYIIGHSVGFDRLTTMHNAWVKSMVCGKEDATLRAHRGSYKTTCVSIALACIAIADPNAATLFMRKTDADIKEVIRQVRNILESESMQVITRAIYGVQLRLTVASATELNTNLAANIKGTSQIVAMGTNGSLTGKHFDRIFTDDIVNVQDRISKAERDHTKLIYQELQNVKNRGGRIFNTGTPWHKDDAFTLMPNIADYDCYSTGLISKEELAEIKSKMLPSLFAANYELRHIASDDVIFTSPMIDADPALAEQGVCHIDAAYGGEDFTAFTICHKSDGKYYVYGRLWRKHVDDVLDNIYALQEVFNAGQFSVEDNGDKGYLAKELRQHGARVHKYHENMNKFIKITTYLKAAWGDVVFVTGTDKEYIEQICDYNENAEHDDAPDSLASMVRWLSKKQTKEPASMWDTYLL